MKCEMQISFQRVEICDSNCNRQLSDNDQIYFKLAGCACFKVGLRLHLHLNKCENGANRNQEVKEFNLLMCIKCVFKKNNHFACFYFYLIITCKIFKV